MNFRISESLKGLGYLKLNTLQGGHTFVKRNLPHISITTIAPNLVLYIHSQYIHTGKQKDKGQTKKT